MPVRDWKEVGITGNRQAVEVDFTPIVDIRVDEREEMRKTRRARVTGYG